MSETTLMSFGYVFGPPEGADTVIGTRGLPNPYWAEELKHKTGLEKEVRDYVFSTPEAEAYYESCLDMLRRRIAFYERYDSPLKTPLRIGIGCTGGKHRSVSMTVRLAAALEGEGIPIRVLHRDLDKTLEHSAGAVVFTREAGEPRFVILSSVFGNPGFPKGHIEAGESDRDTALRETEEETGLRVRLLPGFRAVNVFPLPNKPNTWKQVIYYLGEYENQPLRPRAGEIAEARLLPYEAALSALRFENTRAVLREAKTFLDELPAASARSGGH